MAESSCTAPRNLPTWLRPPNLVGQCNEPTTPSSVSSICSTNDSMSSIKNRKAHKKSRNGCLSCKARHVKCDEQKPRCAICVRQDIECEYRTFTKAFETSSESRSRIPQEEVPVPTELPALEREQISITPTESDVPIDITQMRLLHHYITVTAQSLAVDLEADDILSNKMVQVAFENPYLLHNFLSLAALHINHLERCPAKPRTEFLKIAERHHGAALSTFRTTVWDINESNFTPILMSAGTLFPYSCGLSIAVSDDLEHAFETILSNMLLTRKIRPITSNFYHTMKSSELDRLIPKDVQDLTWDATNAGTDVHLPELRKFAELARQIYSADITEAYIQAISILELVFTRASKFSLSPSSSLLRIWIHLVSDYYVQLLSDKQPGALIIFAYFAVLLKKGEFFWYMEGMADLVLRIVDSHIPKEWRPWIEWPREQIRTRLGLVAAN